MDKKYIKLSKKELEEIVACAFQSGYRMQYGNVCEISCENLLKANYENKVEYLPMDKNIETIKKIKKYLRY